MVGDADAVAARERAIVVTDRWDEGDEADLALRSVAGVLSRSRLVDVLVTSGATAGHHHDGAFDVEVLTADPADTPTRAVVMEALAASSATVSPRRWALPAPADTILGGVEAGTWHQAGARIAAAEPALVLLAGAPPAAALDLIAGLPASTRVVAMPLTADERRLARDGVTAVLHAVDAVLATNPAEVAHIARLTGVTAVEVGVHLPGNPHSRREPPAMLSGWPYAVVVGAARHVGDEAIAHPEAADDTFGMGAWLAGRLAPASPSDGLGPLRIAAVRGRELAVWERGRAELWPVVASRSDLWRILAFARVVVAVDPGPLLARSVLESLLHATPVVARTGTVAAAHLQASGGGLWADDDAGMVEAAALLMEDADAAERLGLAGQAWAEARFGDLDAFAGRVEQACRAPSRRAAPMPAAGEPGTPGVPGAPGQPGTQGEPGAPGQHRSPGETVRQPTRTVAP